MDFFSAKPYFYKAKVLERLGEYDDAVLSFEQVMKLTEDTQLQGNSLYEITKIRVRQRDFYEAYYFLQRADKSKLKLPKLALYNSFTEAAIFLMKRKTKKGVSILTQLIESKSSVGLACEPFLNPLVYIYRAYGRIVLQEYDTALKDLLKASSFKKLPTNAHYNLQLCVGILAIRNKEFDSAMSYFTKAHQKFPQNRNQFLQAVTIIKQANENLQKPEVKLKMAKDAKKIIEKVMEKHKKDYGLMYYRGLLNLYLQCFNDAINDFNTVIEMDEDTAAKYYLGRGR
jgi:tetratricopeptide (TPR) repeat protein